MSDTCTRWTAAAPVGVVPPAILQPWLDPTVVARRLAPALHWPGAEAVEERCWRLVARTADFDAWLIAWPRGGRVELHDHGRSSGAISVISGSLTEAVPHRQDRGRLSLIRNELRAETTIGFGIGHVHDVTNESAGPALSLHVYSPALTSMTLFDLAGDRLVAREVEWISGGDETRVLAREPVVDPLGDVAAR